MRLVFNDIIDPELKKYLLMQEGIINVDIKDGTLNTLVIDYNERITPLVIIKYINLFQDNKISKLCSFDKDLKGDFKILKYMIDDMCCEYCYMNLVMALFTNDKINSVKSNFVFDRPAINIEFIIEYDNEYKEEELIKFIEEKRN